MHWPTCHPSTLLLPWVEKQELPPRLAGEGGGALCMQPALTPAGRDMRAICPPVPFVSHSDRLPTLQSPHAACVAPPLCRGEPAGTSGAFVLITENPT